MASNLEFVEYAAEQMAGAGNITFRKMFGEYGIYCDGKIFGVICDDQLYIKVTEAGQKMAPQLPKASPYTGAKPHFLVEDVDDREFLTGFVTATCKELPMPAPKKPRKKAEKKEEKA